MIIPLSGGLIIYALDDFFIISHLQTANYKSGEDYPKQDLAVTLGAYPRMGGVVRFGSAYHGFVLGGGFGD